MFLDLRRPRVARLSERDLGEAYLAGTGVMLAAVLGPLFVVRTREIAPWLAFGFLPLGGLVAVTYWLQRLDFDRRQVWRTANCAALGTGLVTVCVFGAHLFGQVLTVSSALTVGLTIAVATGTLGGALVGITIESRRSVQRLSVRNSVLDRLLRHNLRNDLTVVLNHVGDVKTTVSGPERGQLETAERRIHALVNLVDNVRQADVAVEPGRRPAEPLDLVSLVRDRVTRLRRTHPDLDVETDLPGSAWVYAEEQFGLAVDNVVESAIVYGSGCPELRIEVDTAGDEVVLRIDDVGRTIPDADLAVLTNGTEETLDHGCGVELWLTRWLTQRSWGTLAIERDGKTRRIELTLPRARR